MRQSVTSTVVKGVSIVLDVAEAQLFTAALNDQIEFISDAIAQLRALLEGIESRLGELGTKLVAQ